MKKLTVKKVKTPAFPNKYFKSQESYFEFSDKYQLYGGDAYDLKKVIDKKLNLTPKLKPPKETR